MSQTVVDDEPTQAYEGKVHVGGSFPTTYKSFLSDTVNGQIYFGKAVAYLSDTELAVGGASGGPQAVAVPNSAADVTDILVGVAPADPSVERTQTNGVNDDFGQYIDETSVQVLRKGMVWVVVSNAVAALSDGVYVRWQVPGGTPPTDALGSFDTVAGANVQLVSGGMAWAGSASIDGVDFGLLELNLPF